MEYQPGVGMPAQRRRLPQIIVTIVLVVLVGVVAFGAYSLVQAHSDITALQRQNNQDRSQVAATASSLATLKTQVSQDAGQLSNIQESVTSLTSQVGAISKPSDPLSAYNQICDSTFQNSTTDLEQLYYYPCTNVVQTTPLPGG
ncbi:MAG TPA: hypothetical protein VG435_09885 [Acidimicrobiales bacterium]|jgi:cell division protein FtsB|nr:hypothetical protein [Acidimicrobiales bacterium]